MTQLRQPVSQCLRDARPVHQERTLISRLRKEVIQSIPLNPCNKSLPADAVIVFLSQQMVGNANARAIAHEHPPLAWLKYLSSKHQS